MSVSVSVDPTPPDPCVDIGVGHVGRRAHTVDLGVSSHRY